VIVVSIVEVDGDFTSSMAKEEGVWRRKKEAGREEDEKPSWKFWRLDAFWGIFMVWF
jgi:hypothetical protein